MNTSSAGNKDGRPTRQANEGTGTETNGILAQLMAALSGVPLRLENSEQHEGARSTVMALRQTAGFLYQTAAEIEKRLHGKTE